MTSTGGRAHWERVYEEKADAQLSWWRARAGLSRTLIEDALRSRGDHEAPARVLDVGGGECTLGVELAALGCEVTVLDLSGAALDRGRRRAVALDTAAAARMRWMEGDVTKTAAETLGMVDVWHDRAVFHFLTDATHQASYASLLESALTPGGVAVIGTFALDGPERCSGLPVVRRDAQGIAAAMGPGFTLVQAHREVHATPWGSEQPFAFSVLRRR